MIIEKPRILPRVAIATLALGGPSVLAGCGGGSGSVDAVQAFCNAKVSCGYSGTAAACESYYNNQLSYYDTACQGAIRNALTCIANANCASTSTCQPAISDAIGSCFNASSPVADFCAQLSMCGQGGLANAKSCATFYGGNESALYTNYGANCQSAYDALLECASQLTCGASVNTYCATQMADYHNYCA